MRCDTTTLRVTDILCTKLSSVHGTRVQLKRSKPKESNISIDLENIPSVTQWDPGKFPESMLTMMKQGKLLKTRLSSLSSGIQPIKLGKQFKAEVRNPAEIPIIFVDVF